MHSPSRSPPPDLPPHRIPLTMQFSATASFYYSDHEEPNCNFSSPRANVKIRLDNTEIQLSLHYLYKSDTAEVKKFVKSDKIARTMVEKGGILYTGC